MIKLFNVILVASLYLAGASLAGCSGDKGHDHEHEHDNGHDHDEMKGDASTAAYICPMGDGWGDKPGPCPGCEMEMVPNPDYKPVEQPAPSSEEPAAADTGTDQ